MKKILFFLTATIVAMSLSAAPVDVRAAQAKAQQYLTNELYAGKIMAPAALNPQLIKTEIGDTKTGKPVYYIFNTTTTFLVVAGDDRAEEILMVGDRPLRDINNLPPAMQEILNQYKGEIQFLHENPRIQVTRLSDTPKLRAVTYGPLLTATWDQEAPYNNLCKFTYNNKTYTCLTGCPATSASMVLYYWKYPTSVSALASYSGKLDISSSSYSTNYVNFTYPALEATTFDWDNMKDSYSGYNYTTAQGTAVATLMRYVGQAEKMMYGVAGSGIYTTESANIATMFKTFGYDDNTRLANKSSYSSTNWATLIQGEMAAGRPVVYLGVDNSAGGHAFNVDGYRDSDSKYHVNFGWSGDGNSWYAMNSFTYSGYTFSSSQQAIVGIQPPTNEPRLTVTPTSLTFTGYAGNTYTQTFTVTGRNLTGNVNLSVSGSGYSVSPSTISATQAASGVTVTVTFNPTSAATYTGTVTVASSGAESKTVALSGTASAQPTLTATPASVNLSTSVGSSAKKTVFVKGTNLAGNVSLSVSGEGFSIDLTTISKSAATSGKSVTVTYAPTTAGTHTGQITLTTTGADPLVVPLNGTANDDTPLITVNPTSLAFSAQTEQTVTKTFTVNGANLTGNLTLTLNDANNVYSINKTSLTASQAASGATVTVTYAPTTAGNHNATVTVSGGGATAQTVSLNGTATEPVRTITATPSSLTFNNLVGETATQTFNVTGENLKGDLTLALNDANGVYSINPATITVAEATAGKTVTVTYAPTAFGNHNASITISGGSANPVTVTLAGQANLIKYAPVMLEPNDLFVAIDRFRAEWTDNTPEANVASYTLEVSPKVVEPEVELLSSVSASAYSSNGYSDITLPSPWGGTNVRGGNSEIYFRNNYNNNGSYGNITYTIPEGYSNATFTMMITSYSVNTNGAGTLAVATPQTAAVTHTFTAGATYYWVVTASSGEKITITTSDSQYSPSIALMAVYTGDATPASLMATESGDANNRLIEGITPDKFYTVTNLAEGGTFLYRVKAIYIDGTESEWSNIEEVTLHENAHPYAIGDVNHDGAVDISDVTELISYVLGNSTTACQICGDMTNDGNIDISDVTALISYILGGSSSLNVSIDPR